MPIYPTNPNNLHDEVYHGKKDAVLPLTSIIGIAGDDIDWHTKYTALSHAFETRTDELVAEIKEKDAQYMLQVEAHAAKNTQLKELLSRCDRLFRFEAENTKLKDVLVDLTVEYILLMRRTDDE